MVEGRRVGERVGSVGKAVNQTRPATTIMALTKQAATSLTGSDQPASHVHNEGPP